MDKTDILLENILHELSCLQEHSCDCRHYYDCDEVEDAVEAIRKDIKQYRYGVRHEAIMRECEKQ